MIASVLTLVMLLFYTSCSKWNYNEVKNIQEVKVPCSSITEQQHIISDSISYYSMLDTNNCTPLQIDFSQKTLLGKYTSGTGCTIEFKRQLYINEKDKESLYVITLKEKGLCKKQDESMNWIIVPKISSDYKVTFKIK